MKKGLSTGYKNIFPLLLITITSWNGSVVDSNNDSKIKRPSVNFYGTLTDHNSTCTVEFIQIGGKHEKIEVYQPIADAKKAIDKIRTPNPEPEIDPKQNKTLLDLAEVSSIELQHPNSPHENVVDINNRTYVSILVTSITGTKTPYLMESSREITCVKIDKGPNNNQQAVEEDRKVGIMHVRKLIITGYKSNNDSNNTTSSRAALSEKQKAEENTNAVLDEIEKTVNNLPKEDPSNYAKIKESLLSLLKSLRAQLQKVLSLIKN